MKSRSKHSPKDTMKPEVESANFKLSVTFTVFKTLGILGYKVDKAQVKKR